MKVLVPKSENTRAQRIYLIAIGLLIWANGLAVAGIIYQTIKGIEYNLLVAILFITVFVCFVVGLWAILNVHPPLHYLISVGAIINLVISIGASSYGLTQGLISVLILYIGIRFPIRFELEKKTLG
jgi:hypothetical protein